MEDMMFSVIEHIPERFIPHFLMEWLDRYTTKRLNKLKQESVRQTWRNICLEDAVNEISARNNP